MKLMNPMNSAFMTEKEVNKLFKQQNITKKEVEKIVDRKIKNQQTQPVNNSSREDQRVQE
jgi:hypothetical protein